MTTLLPPGVPQSICDATAGKRGRGQPLPGIHPTWVFGTDSGSLKEVVVVNGWGCNYLELAASVTTMRLVLASPEAKLRRLSRAADRKTEDS
jgi:hypothetical protein